MEDNFGDRVFKTIIQSVVDTKSSWSPNSTYFHLDFHLCNYTNRKDTAGQSSRHNPGHILICRFVRCRYKLYLIDPLKDQERRIDWIKSDLVEKLGTELKTWEASVRWVALLDNLGIGGLYRAANRAGKYCEFWVQNSGPIFTILSVRLSVTHRDTFLSQIIFLFFCSIFSLLSKPNIFSKYFPFTHCIIILLRSSFPQLTKYFPPCPFMLFFSYANLILSLFKYFPTANIFPLALLRCSSPTLISLFPSSNIFLLVLPRLFRTKVCEIGKG